MICVLSVVEGPATGRKCWLRSDQRLSIGRLSTSDFPIPDDLHLSRNHLMVEGARGTFRVRDAGSRNGTWVNQMQISSMEICDGDTIRAGKSTILVHLLGGDQPEPAVSSAALPGATDTENTLAGLAFVPVRTVTAPSPPDRPAT